MNIDLKELYNTNEDFKGYVDRCRRRTGATVEEMLKLHIVWDYAGYLIERDKDNAY